MMTGRRYPVGIQTFSRVIRDGYIYVDKTDLVWQLAHYATYVFMSRPRRFGKSLLTSTLESYFKGERELFEEPEDDYQFIATFDRMRSHEKGPLMVRCGK